MLHIFVIVIAGTSITTCMVLLHSNCYYCMLLAFTAAACLICWCLLAAAFSLWVDYLFVCYCYLFFATTSCCLLSATSAHTCMFISPPEMLKHNSCHICTSILITWRDHACIYLMVNLYFVDVIIPKNNYLLSLYLYQCYILGNKPAHCTIAMPFLTAKVFWGRTGICYYQFCFQWVLWPS